jgi:UDP-N-acetyl-2-amino-2-deoxyglucuronate dehydrogenase
MISWKGDIEKSGGIATNIGIHFFDMLQLIFGDVQHNILHINERTRARGFLELNKARVRWFLSLDRHDLPEPAQDNHPATFRSIKINGQEIEFSGGFTDLHTKSYEAILAGNGFKLADAKTSVQITSDIRRSKAIGLHGDYHPFLKNNK